jgi:hypothetical protein
MNVSTPSPTPDPPPDLRSAPRLQLSALSPAIRRLNRNLDDLARPQAVNESALAGCLMELEGIGPAGRGPAFWLSAARLTELALWCAGAYADNFEFEAAGDLLVNPRRILIHDRLRQWTVIKQRHARLSDQLSRDGIGGRGPGGWMPAPEDLETAEPPLLPYLEARLTRSGALRSWYLEHIRARMREIADAAAFLAAWSLSSIEDLHTRLRHASPARRAFIESHLCRFDLRLFDMLGRELSGARDTKPSRLLANPMVSGKHKPPTAATQAISGPIGLPVEEIVAT